MKKKWLRQAYQGLPPGIQRVLANDRLRTNVCVLRSCLRRNPHSVAVRSRLASSLADQGRKLEAFHIWRSLLRRQRRRASLYFQRAHWAMNAQNHAEAEKFLRLCLREDDGYFGETAHFWRAEALSRLGRYKAATHALESVSDEYYELWFFGKRRWSKADLVAELVARERA